MKNKRIEWKWNLNIMILKFKFEKVENELLKCFYIIFNILNEKFELLRNILNDE